VETVEFMTPAYGFMLAKFVICVALLAVFGYHVWRAIWMNWPRRRRPSLRQED
jgi:hypothetical protein